MKKIISIMIALMTLVSCFALTGCGNEEKAETLKFGLGVYAVYGSATDATEEKDGSVKGTTNAAAVLVDSNGKIVDVVIDTVDGKVSYNTAGELVVVDEYKTKQELKNDYGMSATGKVEWYEQVAKFVALVKGKTLAQVKALVADTGYGTEEVTTAGCTIAINEFVVAIEKAVNNAVASKATKNDKLSLAMVTTQDKGANATEDADGKVEVIANIVAAVTKGGKVVAIETDCSQIKFGFTINGANTTDTTAAIATKREKGNNYGMSATGKVEWYEQVNALDALYVGKTSSEIAALVVDGAGNADVIAAGCTIDVTGLVAAAVKATK